MDSAYLNFLYRLGEFNIKLGLDTIRSILERLGHPHQHPRIIHIAGTNGKGSTLKTLESLLIASGFTTGSTISPHLITINERFRINGTPVDDDGLNNAFREVCRQCDIPLDLSSPVSLDGAIRPTFFEFSLAMAFVLFESAGVDYILLETGLGGRLDATNVIEKPLACVITRIAMDHQEYLGSSIEAIVGEKLGILKKGSPVFVAPQDGIVSRLIRSRCESGGFKYFTSPEDFYREDGKNGLNISVKTDDGLQVLPGEFSTVSIQHVGLHGEHQKDNILTAMAVYLKSVPREFQLEFRDLEQVIEHLEWPGRLQYLKTSGDILLDGAHNASGMQALLDYLSVSHDGEQIILAVGWMKDKNLFGDIDLSRHKNITFLPVKIDNDRAEKMKTMVLELQSYSVTVLSGTTCPELVSAKRGGSLPDHDLLVVAGSLYLVGVFLERWQDSDSMG